MPDIRSSLYAFQRRRFALVLGTNEIASAVAVQLAWADYAVVLSHDAFPPVIRRGMSFHDALFEDSAEVDGMIGRRAESLFEVAELGSQPGQVVVTPLALTDLIALRMADVLVDARMQKNRVTPDFRNLARVAIGLGPKFFVGVNCDIAVETHPAHNGALVESGATDDPDGKARELGGVGAERFVYSDRAGVWRTPVEIGMWVPRGYVIGRHDRMPVCAPIDGYVRGVARDGSSAPAGVKLLEIDPRGRSASWTGSDERGRAIAEATLQAIKAHPPRRAPAFAEAAAKV